MEINTTRFGNINIKKESIISIPNGLIGFENEKEFILIPSQKNQLLGWLQSTKNPSIAFVVANPYDFYNNYEFNMENEDVDDLLISEVNEVCVLTIIVVPQKIEEITANLLAPIVINTKNKQGKQIILKSNKYQTKHYIIKDLQNASKKDTISQENKLMTSLAQGQTLLILSRKLDESIIINENIEIKVIEIKDNTVRIGIAAPREIPIYRSEVFKEIEEENKKAAEVNVENLDSLLSITSQQQN